MDCWHRPDGQGRRREEERSRKSARVCGRVRKSEVGEKDSGQWREGGREGMRDIYIEVWCRCSKPFGRHPHPFMLIPTHSSLTYALCMSTIHWSCSMVVLDTVITTSYYLPFLKYPSFSFIGRIFPLVVTSLILLVWFVYLWYKLILCKSMENRAR